MEPLSTTGSTARARRLGRGVAGLVAAGLGLAVITAPAGTLAAPVTVTHQGAPLTFAQYTIPTPSSSPNHLITGPDGNLWFTEFLTGKIGRMTPAGSFTEFPVVFNGSPLPCLVNLVTGPDANLWFTDVCADVVGSITPAGAIRLFPVPTTDPVLQPWASFGLGRGPYGITAGPDGNLWVTEAFTDRVLQLTTSGAYGKDFLIPHHPPLPRNVNVVIPDFITVGADNNLWFTENRYGGGPLVGNRVVRMTVNGAFTEYPIPTQDSAPQFITRGAGTMLWFSEGRGNKIGRIDISTGVVVDFPIATANSHPDQLTLGPDHAMWFTEALTPNIARISPNGVITEYAGPVPIPSESLGPLGITQGPDHNIWFTDVQPNLIVRATVPYSGTSVTESAGATGLPTKPQVQVNVGITSAN